MPQREFSKVDDKNDLPDAEARIDTFDGEKGSPPPYQPFAADLGLKLIGTLVVDSPKKSVAVIEYSTSRVRETVKEGDRAGNVRIKKILHDRIIVDDGQSELQIALMPVTTGGQTCNLRDRNTSTVALAGGRRHAKFVQT